MPNPKHLLKTLWNEHNLSEDALDRIHLAGADPVFPSSFAVGSAALVSMASAAAMAAEIGQIRGLPQQTISVDMQEAAIECTGRFTLDGKSTPSFAELSGLYQCNDGWLRLHANFDHHRDAALSVTGLPTGSKTPRMDLEAKALHYSCEQLESAVLEKGGACATVRTFDEWDKLPQAKAVESLPLVEITKLGEANPKSHSTLSEGQPPLSNIRILDLTRILAGPVCGRTLAAYGADVMLINSPNLPNIDSIIETSRGKLSAHIDLTSETDKHALHRLLKDTHAFVQGYRPGAIASHELSPEALAERYPGIVYTSLSAYGRSGPWSSRRGFDSLLQSASGFNMAEAQSKGTKQPTALPMQILDYASGFLMAFGTQVALQKQITEGGSWHVQVSLARTGLWLRSFGQNSDWLNCTAPSTDAYLQTYASSYGDLRALPHPIKFSESSVEWKVPSSTPGTHQPIWPT